MSVAFSIAASVGYGLCPPSPLLSNHCRALSSSCSASLGGGRLPSLSLLPSPITTPSVAWPLARIAPAACDATVLVRRARQPGRACLSSARNPRMMGGGSFRLRHVGGSQAWSPLNLSACQVARVDMHGTGRSRRNRLYTRRDAPSPCDGCGCEAWWCGRSLPRSGERCDPARTWKDGREAASGPAGKEEGMRHGCLCGPPVG